MLCRHAEQEWLASCLFLHIQREQQQNNKEVTQKWRRFFYGLQVLAYSTAIATAVWEIAGDFRVVSGDGGIGGEEEAQ